MATPSFAERIPAELGKSPIKLDVPSPQPFFHYQKAGWQPAESYVEIIKETNTKSPKAIDKPCSIRLTTWNIDFGAPYKKERMAGALEYLSQLHTLSTTPSAEETPDTPVVIFLQEVTDSDLEQIRQMQWVQDHFFITDLSDQYWHGYYTTTALIDQRLNIQRVLRVPYKVTSMQRDALFVDINIGGGDTHDRKIVRLCNTHLESLRSNSPRRFKQLELASEFMHGSGPSSTKDFQLPVPHASILAGDLNACEPEDHTAPVGCGLKDAFLTLGGVEGTGESFTWGQQVPDASWEEHGYSRLDKILFCGAVDATAFQRIGEGLKVNAGSLISRVEEVWVTDHLGLQADFKIE